MSDLTEPYSWRCSRCAGTGVLAVPNVANIAATHEALEAVFESVIRVAHFGVSPTCPSRSFTVLMPIVTTERSGMLTGWTA